MQFAASSCAGNESFRSEDHDRNENDTKNQVTNIAEGETRNEMNNSSLNSKKHTGGISGQSIQLRKNKLVDSIDSKRANNHPRNTADATNDHHSQENYGVAEAKVIRRD